MLQTDNGRRSIATAVGGAIAGVVMVLLGMEPRLALVGFVVMVVATLTWLIADLGHIAEPVNWHNYATAANDMTRPDRRVQVLKARLRQSTRRRRTGGLPGTSQTNRADPIEEIGESLVAVIDDHLLADRGIDRSLDPAGAAEELGDALTRFVTDPDARGSMTRRRTLAHTVALIEDFTSSTDST